MKPKDDIKYKISECLHLIADIIADGKSNEIPIVLEKALRQAKKELLAGHTSSPNRSQAKSKIENTAPAQESIAIQENKSSLSIKEFGRDITSDKEFPTRDDLFNFARSQGVQVAKRDSKATIRNRLLSNAELRNMDKLIDQGKEE